MEKPLTACSGRLRFCSGQAMAEYVIALFLCAMFAVGTFKTYQHAMRVHYNRVAKARTGSTGMRP
ncbi:MAG: hypothetical protein CVU78_06585 [Elusimicrobia bacterium HGW-Elusimicrobia-2]|nr:MAG: hypothetical protein CVU78_06585 [Elusimicrobia bacterium HGW-Elusimicrobia-2]